MWYVRVRVILAVDKHPWVFPIRKSYYQDQMYEKFDSGARISDSDTIRKRAYQARHAFTNHRVIEQLTTLRA